MALGAHVTVTRAGGFALDARISAAAGETVAIMGPSGAGKSTLLAVLAGRERAAASQVMLGGRDIGAAEPRRRGTILLGQDPQLFPHLNARDNVAFGLRSHRMPRAAARERADVLLGDLGLSGMGDRRVSELSGGQQQRVALARALAVTPGLLLLDEPLTSLDPATAGEMRALLAERLADVTTLIVTHDALDAAALADRLVVLEAGRVSQDAPVRTVFDQPASASIADLVGVNRLEGALEGDRFTADGVVLAVSAGIGIRGRDLAAVFAPSAVRLGQDDDSSTVAAGAGEWTARIVRMQQTPAGVRLLTEPGAVVADVSVRDVAAAGLAPGREVRLRVAREDVRIIAR